MHPEHRPRRAIVTSVHSWDGPIQVGAHHLARGLAACGWRVLFLSDPVTSVHLLAGQSEPRARARLAAARRGLVQARETAIQHLVPFSWMPLSGRFGAGSGFVLRNWMRFTQPSLRGRLRGAGFDRPELIVFDGALQAPLIDALRPARVVLRIFDRPSGRGGMTPALLAREAELAQRADLTIVTASTLIEDARAMRARKVLHLPNGVDVARFSAPVAHEPALLRTIPRPRVIYVGALEAWFDASLLNALARQLPDVSFVIGGPTGPGAQGLIPRPNLHRLGVVPPADLPSYLRSADVGIIPFDTARHRTLLDGVNPLKLYEYLAAGLPVIASRWAELERLSAPIALADTEAQWLGAIRSAIAAGQPSAALDFVRRVDWRTEIVPTLLAALDFAVDGV